MKFLDNLTQNSEFKFLFWLSVAVVLLVSLPYLYAMYNAPAGTQYLGINSLTPGDNPVYYSYIAQIQAGSTTLIDLFTGETQADGLFNIFWYLTGLLAKTLQLTPIVAFHLMRVLLAPVFVFGTYGFLKLFFADQKLRKTILVILLFSAGLGAYVIGPISAFDFSSKPGYWTPNDIWVPESIIFLTLYKTPHFIASAVLMMWQLGLMFFALQRRIFWPAIMAGFLGLFHFNFHPFYIPFIFLTIGLYVLYLTVKQNKIIWKSWSIALIYLLLTLPAIFYHIFTLQTNPVLSQRAVQNITLAPPFIFILVGYGLLWVFAILGLRQLIKEKKIKDQVVFFLIWIAVSIALVVLPNQFQSRYLQALHLPLVVFSSIWLLSKISDKKNSWFNQRVIVVAGFVVLLAVSNIFNLLRDLYYYTVQPPAVAQYLYISDSMAEAMQKLALIPKDSVVLAPIDRALFIPGFSNRQVYAAHGIETTHYLSKLPLVQWFYWTNDSDEAKKEFLLEQNIAYIFFDLNSSNQLFVPAEKDYLELFFTSADASIYKVVN